MIVPQFWAEGRAQHRVRNKRITIRRFGWSDTSVDEAQAMADARATEALGKHLAGERVRLRDHKRAYNGAEGLPIREEVLQRHGQAVITRNLYGARCLNVPDVLFADIDFASESSSLFTLVASGVALAAMAVVAYLYGWKAALAAGVAVALLAYAWSKALSAARKPKQADAAEAGARARIDAFVATHPEWLLRRYRTPAGLRLLAMHRRFDPAEPAVKEFFEAIGVDKIYARMCQNQQCFRARLSAKPWRIGLREALKPRPGVWPVKPEHLPTRARWVDEYERRAAGFAACRYLDTVGRGRSDIDADRIRDLHDDLSGAMRNLPLA